MAEGKKSMFQSVKGIFLGAYKRYRSCFKCLTFAWGCAQMWTPISLTFLIYWLVYRPDQFHPHTESAVLAVLDLTNNASAIQYDLAVDLSVRNSHRLPIRYLDVAASVFYNGTRLGPTDDPLHGFVQKPKNITVLHPAFHGVVNVDSDVVAQLQRERAEGTVHLRVTVSLTVMYKVWSVKDVFFYKYDCWLWFTTPHNGKPTHFHGNGTVCWRV
uniref:Uncharacterized protein n=1 Tax=Avena sativa TaxID=4498 RepID=A0ACD5V8Q2_AVESA